MPLKPMVLYSNALLDEFVINTVFAAPTAVSPVPPIDTGATPVTIPEDKLTEELASLAAVTAESAISPEGIVLLAMFAFTRLPAVIADAPFRFFNV